MNVTSETVSSIQKRLKVEVPAERIKKEVERKLNKISKTAKISGFRPGKVPMSHVRQQYGAGAQQEAINDVIRETVFEAIDAQEIRAVGAPDIEDVKVENELLSYSALVEVYPEVEVSGLDKIEVERVQAQVSDADVEEMIESLQKQRQSFAEADKALEDTDQATFDFKGTVNGEAFEGGAAEDFKLVIGSGRMIPGFEDGMKGMKAGETKTIDVTFPEDYQAENLKGKAAQFEITVKKVEEAKLPELNQEFFELFGVKEGGLDALKADVRKNMEREVKNASRTLTKRRVFDGLVEQNEIELPQSLVKHEIERQRQMMVQRFMQQFGGQNAGQFNSDMLPDDLFTEPAMKSARLSVLLASFIDNRSIELDQDRVDAFISEMSENYEDPSEVIEYYKNDQKQRSQIEGAVLEDQVVEAILADAKVTDQNLSYKELLTEAQKAAQ